jgi:hypothetical protein
MIGYDQPDYPGLSDTDGLDTHADEAREGVDVESGADREVRGQTVGGRRLDVEEGPDLAGRSVGAQSTIAWLTRALIT